MSKKFKSCIFPLIKFLAYSKTGDNEISLNEVPDLRLHKMHFFLKCLLLLYIKKIVYYFYKAFSENYKALFCIVFVKSGIYL